MARTDTVLAAARNTGPSLQGPLKKNLKIAFLIDRGKGSDIRCRNDSLLTLKGFLLLRQRQDRVLFFFPPVISGFVQSSPLSTRGNLFLDGTSSAGVRLVKSLTSTVELAHLQTLEINHNSSRVLPNLLR